MSDSIRLILNCLFIYNASFTKCYIYTKSCLNNIGQHLNKHRSHYAYMYFFEVLVPFNMKLRFFLL